MPPYVLYGVKYIGLVSLVSRCCVLYSNYTLEIKLEIEFKRACKQHLDLRCVLRPAPAVVPGVPTEHVSTPAQRTLTPPPLYFFWFIIGVRLQVPSYAVVHARWAGWTRLDPGHACYIVLVQKLRLHRHRRMLCLWYVWLGSWALCSVWAKYLDLVPLGSCALFGMG